MATKGESIPNHPNPVTMPAWNLLIFCKTTTPIETENITKLGCDILCSFKDVYSNMCALVQCYSNYPTSIIDSWPKIGRKPFYSRDFKNTISNCV